MTNKRRVHSAPPPAYRQDIDGKEAEDLVLEHAARILEGRIRRDAVALTSSSLTKQWLRLQLSHEREEFQGVFLDNQHRLITAEVLFQGTIDGSMVSPREVVKAALKRNAAAVLFAHNHPSGVAEPSQADIGITRRLKDALALVDIRVLDHLVVGEDVVVSLAERGLL
jgi:DNA repair protein RadC